MAKKDPTDLTVEEKLKALYQLQTTLSGIDEKRALRGELPLEEQTGRRDAGLNTPWTRSRARMPISVGHCPERNEIEMAQQSVERYKNQLEEVRNKREYDTLTRRLSSRRWKSSSATRKSRRPHRKSQNARKTCSARKPTLPTVSKT
jgi:hypothetical protein